MPQLPQLHRGAKAYGISSSYKYLKLFVGSRTETIWTVLRSQDKRAGGCFCICIDHETPQAASFYVRSGSALAYASCEFRAAFFRFGAEHVGSSRDMLNLKMERVE